MSSGLSEHIQTFRLFLRKLKSMLAHRRLAHGHRPSHRCRPAHHRRPAQRRRPAHRRRTARRRRPEQPSQSAVRPVASSHQWHPNRLATSSRRVVSPLSAPPIRSTRYCWKQRSACVTVRQMTLRMCAQRLLPHS